MGALFLLAIIVLVFAALDIAAYRWGADSRRTPADTHGNQNRDSILG